MRSIPSSCVLGSNRCAHPFAKYELRAKAGEALLHEGRLSRAPLLRQAATLERSRDSLESRLAFEAHRAETAVAELHKARGPRASRRPRTDSRASQPHALRLLPRHLLPPTCQHAQ